MPEIRGQLIEKQESLCPHGFWPGACSNCREDKQSAELVRVASSIETEDGRKILSIKFSKEMRPTLNAFVSEDGPGVLFREGGVRVIDEFFEDLSRMTTDQRKHFLIGVDVETLKQIAEMLRNFKAEEYSGGRFASFENHQDLMDALMTAGTDGGTTNRRSTEGSCFDDGQWARSHFFSRLSPHSSRPGIIFLHDLDEMVRIPKDETTDDLLHYYGYKPKEGNTFADSLKGILVFE